MSNPIPRILGAVLILALAAVGCSKKQIDYGTASEFTLPGIEGNQVSLSDFKGKIVMLNFWATWCPGCVEEIPYFIELYHEYKDQGFEMVGVSRDKGGAAVVKPFAEKKNVNYTMLLDDKNVAGKYGTKGILPTTFLIDRTGQIRQKYVGARSKALFEKDIKALLTESKVPPQTATAPKEVK